MSKMTYLIRLFLAALGSGDRLDGWFVGTPWSMPRCLGYALFVAGVTILVTHFDVGLLQLLIAILVGRLAGGSGRRG